MYHYILVLNKKWQPAKCKLPPSNNSCFRFFMSVACILTRFAQNSQLSAVIANIFATFLLFFFGYRILWVFHHPIWCFSAT